MNGKKQGRVREIGARGGRRVRFTGGLKPLACALILAAPAAQAQTAPDAAGARTLAPITVSANPPVRETTGMLP